MLDEEYSEYMNILDFIRNFNVHFALLLRRFKRFKEINNIGNNDIDVITYLDMIIVQLRAMCIENERYKKNYTVQNLLRIVGEESLAHRIDKMLNEEIFDGMNVRTGLKILADEFICHYDNFDDENMHRLSLADILMKRLRNPYERINLDYIMHELIDCIGEGLTVR